MQPILKVAARKIDQSDALLITAGAGMGVDSGLPDFRGDEGFWRAYPPFREAGISFVEAANPRWFRTDPTRAWGFYGHRFNLYAHPRPHAGFQILRKWAESKPTPSFVFTSNVDGHFQRAGFDSERIVERHGSLNHWQCFHDCERKIQSMESVQIAVEEKSLRAAEPLPKCPSCESVARPNVLMFGDHGWNESRTNQQLDRYAKWSQHLSEKQITVIELGAGMAVPTVRWESEAIVSSHQATLIRINPRDPQGPEGTLSIPLGALDGLQKIAEHSFT